MLEAAREIILCESIIDALTFWCAGYRNVTASYGVNGFSDDHRAALNKYETKRVLIAHDRDEAGEKAAAALAEELMGLRKEPLRTENRVRPRIESVHSSSPRRSIHRLL